MQARSSGQVTRTRSSRWTTTWLRRPIHSAARSACTRTRPLAKTSPSGPAISTASSGRKPPSTPVTPAASSERPRLGQRHPRPLVDGEAARRAQGEGDPQLAGRAAGSPGPGTPCPTPGSPASAAASTPGRAASAITVCTPDQVAILAAASFEAMPPLPTALPGTAGQALELVVDLDHLFDQRRLGVAPGVGGQQARRVGEQHEELRADQVGDQRGQPVVVAEADLLVGHGVVLVDDRAPRRGRPGGAASPARAGTACGARSRAAPAGPGRPARRADRGRPATGASGGAGPPRRRPGATAGSDGRCSPRSSAAQPAAMAPEVTTTTVWPGRRAAAAISPHSRPHRRPSVTEDEPTLTTAITARPPR